MNVLSVLGYFVGIPALMFALLSARFMLRKGVHPTTYDMADRWSHPPILWAAVDEVVGAGHGHGKSEFSVGGAASGKW